MAYATAAQGQAIRCAPVVVLKDFVYQLVSGFPRKISFEQSHPPGTVCQVHVDTGRASHLALNSNFVELSAA